MPGLYQIHWLPSGRTEMFAGSRGNYYVISEQDRLGLHSVPVWCYRCERMTEGEQIPTLEELDRQIRDLTDPSSTTYRMARQAMLPELIGEAETFLQNYIAELHRRRRWRESRQSPPKCILCGTTKILQLPIDEPIPSPCGGDQLRIQLVGMCSTDFNDWFFSPEGDRITQSGEAL